MEAGANLLDESHEILVDIDRRNPGVDRWSGVLQDGQFKQARWIHNAGDAATAEARYREAVAISERRHYERPNDVQWATRRARDLRALGDCLLDLGRGSEALRLVQQARDVRLETLAVEPLNAEAWLGLVTDLFWCSQVNLALGNLEEAEREIRAAETRLEKLIVRDPQNLEAARQMVQVLSALASIVWKSQGTVAADAQLTRAAAAADAVLEIVPTSVFDAKTAAETWEFVAAIRASIDNKTGAAEASQNARRVYLTGLDLAKGATHRAFRIGLLSLDLNTALAASVATDVLRIGEELSTLQREALAETGSASRLFDLCATLLYRARACLLLNQTEPALTAFAEIRTRCAQYRSGGTTLDNRMQFAKALVEYQDALRAADRPTEADDVAREAMPWFEALHEAGAEVGEYITKLQQLLGK